MKLKGDTKKASDEDSNPASSKIKHYNTWDIETVNWNEFVIGCVYNGKEARYAYTPKEVLQIMLEWGGIYYAHFAGGFDNLFLLEVLAPYTCKIRNIDGRLVRISVYKNKKKLFELRDSYPILSSSLVNLQKSFNIKGELSEKKILEYKSRRGNIKSFSTQELHEYVKSDTVVLYDILKLAQETFATDDLAFTIASGSMQKFKTMFPTEHLEVHKNRDEYFRNAYVGGRVEVFTRYGKNLTHYDFKSMYPWVMKTKEYPAGTCAYTHSYRDGLLGIYRCNIKAPELYVPLLHCRRDGKLLFPCGEWEGTYTSPEIERARELGYTIDVVDGFFFTKKITPFTEYVDTFYKVKAKAEKEDKPALRYIAKLYLNSLYGKFGQRRQFAKVFSCTKTEMIDMVKKGVEVLDYIEPLEFAIIREESKSLSTSVHIAAFVTAYARLALFDVMHDIHQKGGTLFYCDTDCVITDIKLPTGKALGDLDVEGNIDEGYFLFPKLYAYKYQNEKPIKRAKGFSNDMLHYNAYKKALNGDMTGFDQTRDGIAGILRGHKQHKHHLDVIVTRKLLKATFNKRRLEGIKTRPLILSREWIP